MDKWKQTSTDRVNKKTGEYIVFCKPVGWVCPKKRNKQKSKKNK